MFGIGDELHEANRKLKQALCLLREWKDRHGGKEVHRFTDYMGNKTSTASPTDLLRETQKLLEGR